MWGFLKKVIAVGTSAHFPDRWQGQFVGSLDGIELLGTPAGRDMRHLAWFDGGHPCQTEGVGGAQEVVGTAYRSDWRTLRLVGFQLSKLCPCPRGVGRGVCQPRPPAGGAIFRGRDRHR